TEVPSSNPHLEVDSISERDQLEGHRPAAFEPDYRGGPSTVGTFDGPRVAAKPNERTQTSPFPQAVTEDSIPTDLGRAEAGHVRASPHREAVATTEQPPSDADGAEPDQIAPSQGPEAAATTGQPPSEEPTGPDHG